MFNAICKEFGKITFGELDTEGEVSARISEGRLVLVNREGTEILDELGGSPYKKNLYDKNNAYIRRHIDGYQFGIKKDGNMVIRIMSGGAELYIHTYPDTEALEAVMRYVDEAAHLDGTFDATSEVFDGKRYSRVLSYGAGHFDDLALDMALVLLRETMYCVTR